MQDPGRQDLSAFLSPKEAMDTALIGAVTAILIVAWAIYAMGALKLNQPAIESFRGFV